ncbi:MAG: carboxymuconolactone decarboxylase family protein [Clostridiales bacterium]|nr:carboxymuconolactone decarboxylase family protein [Clostridiales bacterium]
MPGFFELWEKESPETYKAFFGLAGTLQKHAGLDEKTFQLVYLGIQAHRGAKDSVAAHAGFAKKAGATKEEVLGAVLVSLMTAGINGVSECLEAAANGYDNA